MHGFESVTYIFRYVALPKQFKYPFSCYRLFAIGSKMMPVFEASIHRACLPGR